jgi:hypothetical protein
MHFVPGAGGEAWFLDDWSRSWENRSPVTRVVTGFAMIDAGSAPQNQADPRTTLAKRPGIGRTWHRQARHIRSDLAGQAT